MTVLTFRVSILKTAACVLRGAKLRGVGWLGGPARLPRHPCSSATRQLLLFIFFVQEIPPIATLPPLLCFIYKNQISIPVSYDECDSVAVFNVPLDNI